MSTAPPADGDALARIRQISDDADEYFIQLHTEIERMRLERRRRSAAELAGALETVATISANASALHVAAERTASMLARNLAKANALADGEPESPAWLADEENVSVVDEYETALEPAEEPVGEEPEGKDDSDIPFTPFTAFNVPPRIMEAKKKLDNDNPNKWWNHTMYSGPSGEPVEVIYCKTMEESEAALKPFLDEKFIGFDMEWMYPVKNKFSIRY